MLYMSSSFDALIIFCIFIFLICWNNGRSSVYEISLLETKNSCFWNFMKFSFLVSAPPNTNSTNKAGQKSDFFDFLILFQNHPINSEKNTTWECFSYFPRKRKAMEARNESAVCTTGHQARRTRNRKPTFPAFSTPKLVRNMPYVRRSVRNCLSSPEVDGTHACKSIAKTTSRDGKPIRRPACHQAIGWIST